MLLESYFENSFVPKENPACCSLHMAMKLNVIAIALQGLIGHSAFPLQRKSPSRSVFSNIEPVFLMMRN